MSDPQANPPKPRVNQRASRRQKSKSSTRAIAYQNWLGLGKNVALTVLDISETGIRLTLKSQLPIGQEFELNLESIGSKTVKVIAEVVWSIEAQDGTFVTGAKFQKPISYRDLHQLANV